MAAEACLERSYYLDYEEDPVTTLTEGVVCLQESQRNLTNILEFIFRGPELHTEEFLAASEQQYVEAEVEEEEVEMADQMSSLVHQRHCNIAASTKGSNRYNLQIIKKLKYLHIMMRFCVSSLEKEKYFCLKI